MKSTQHYTTLPGLVRPSITEVITDIDECRIAISELEEKNPNDIHVHSQTYDGSPAGCIIARGHHGYPDQYVFNTKTVSNGLCNSSGWGIKPENVNVFTHIPSQMKTRRCVVSVPVKGEGEICTSTEKCKDSHEDLRCIYDHVESWTDLKGSGKCLNVKKNDYCSKDCLEKWEHPTKDQSERCDWDKCASCEWCNESDPEYVKLCKLQSETANSHSCRLFMHDVCKHADATRPTTTEIMSSDYMQSCKNDAALTFAPNAEDLCHHVAFDYSDSKHSMCRELINQMCNSASGRMNKPGWGGEYHDYTNRCEAQHSSPP